jgi:anti-sigma regulatory factor (Ser/Thr protein kinase)
MCLELELPRTRDGPRLARLRLAQWLGSELDDRKLGDATLLTCELVTNALQHGRGMIELRTQLDENRLMVEVIDQGTGFERLLRERDSDTIGGWGLKLVESIASRWGIHEGTSHVWFELDRPGSRL